MTKSIWQNTENSPGNNGNNKGGKTKFEPCPIDDDLIPTKSLKEAIKTRPSVSEFVKVSFSRVANLFLVQITLQGSLLNVLGLLWILFSWPPLL